jgi:hypothetical protein
MHQQDHRRTSRTTQAGVYFARTLPIQIFANIPNFRLCTLFSWSDFFEWACSARMLTLLLFLSIRFCLQVTDDVVEAFWKPRKLEF